MSVVALAALLLTAGPRYQGSPSELEARAKGRAVLRELVADFDGDHKDDLLVIEREGEVMRARVLAVEGEPGQPKFRELASSTPRKADRLARLELKEVTGDRSLDAVVVFEESSPDEVIQHLRVLGRSPSGGVAELFAQTFIVPRGAPAEGELVEFGDARPRFAIRDQAGDDDLPGAAVIAWVRGPQTLLLDKGPAPINLVIGAYEQIYRYQPERGTFASAEGAEVHDFIPAIPAYTVEASAQVPKIWGTAQPFWGADGDLGTAWTAMNKKGGAGESLTVTLKAPAEVSLVRLVPGCAASPEAWAGADRIRAFTIELSSGVRFEIDRSKLDQLPRQVRAAGEFPLEGGFGAQDLFLLAEAAPVRWVRLTITQVEKSPKPVGDREVCLSELSLHAAEDLKK